MENTYEDLFETSLSDVLTDISLAALEEDMQELDAIDKYFDEAYEIITALDSMDLMTTEELTEDVVMKGSTARKERRRQVKEFKRRHGSVAKNAFKTYGNITKAGGNIIFATWNMVTKLVDVVVKVVKVMSDKLVALPNAVSAFIDKTSKVLPHLKNKLQGHLNIHIRAEDIEKLYGENMFVIIDDVINTGLVMAEGDLWVTRIKDFQVSDVRLAKRIGNYHKKLSDLKFTEVTINLNDKNNVEMYFGNKEYIKIKDNGTTKRFNYFGAIQQVAIDLRKRQANIKKVSGVLDKKLRTTEASQQFGRLPEKKQKLIKESVNYVANSILIIERFGKYVMRDVNTMNKFIRECIDNTKKTPHKDQIRDNIRNDRDKYQLRDPEKEKLGPKPKGLKARRAWRKKKREIEKADITKGPVQGRSLWADWESFSGEEKDDGKKKKKK